MQYMGGKERQAKHVVRVIKDHVPGHTDYLEPFMGGGSIFSRVAPMFPGRAVGADAHPDLILMWRALQAGWVPPGEVSREEWYALKASEPSALRGFVGFGCSFGGRWFEGYARNNSGKNYAETARRGALRKAEGMAGAEIVRSEYRTLRPGPGTLVYCDPPYANTKPYSGMPRFDTLEFWAVAHEWASCGATVLVSEYAGPEWAHEVWSRAAHVSLNRTRPGDAVEKIFKVPAYVEAA